MCTRHPGQRQYYAAPLRGLEPKAGHNQALTIKTILGRILLYSFFGVGGYHGFVWRFDGQGLSLTVWAWCLGVNVVWVGCLGRSEHPTTHPTKHPDTRPRHPTKHPDTQSRHPTKHPDTRPSHPTKHPRHPTNHPNTRPGHPTKRPDTRPRHPTRHPTKHPDPPPRHPTKHPDTPPRPPTNHPDPPPTHPTIYPTPSPPDEARLISIGGELAGRCSDNASRPAPRVRDCRSRSDL